MIYRNGQLITEIHLNIKEIIDTIQSAVLRDIGAVYKGSQLVWRTVYNAIKSCFGSGVWIQDKPWLDNDNWKNN